MIAQLNISGDDNTIKLEEISPIKEFRFDTVSRSVIVDQSPTDGESLYRLQIKCTIRQWQQTVRKHFVHIMKLW